MPPCSLITVDTTPANGDFFFIRESENNGSESSVKHEYVSPAFNLEAVETASNATDLSTVSEGEVRKLAQLTYRNECLKYSNKSLHGLTNEPTDRTNANVNENVEEDDGNVKYSSKVDHVYEEVNTLECDIIDYYEKYSPTTAKTLINTLFLPRQKICKQCANLRDSPIHSDNLIYGRKALHAREMKLFQENDSLCYKYCVDGKDNATLFSQYDDVQHCLLVYNYTKTNTASIFYFYGPPRDIFDLKTALKPNIILLNCDEKSVTTNTELYHRYASDFYARISNNGTAPTTFRMNHSKILSSIKHVGYDTDLQNWMNYRNDVIRSHCLKQDDAIDPRANRSSLLLLEPLLLMPELANPRYRRSKNRISQSENMKLVKIVIVYTLSFFILAAITFYIVYFT